MPGNACFMQANEVLAVRIQARLIGTAEWFQGFYPDPTKPPPDAGLRSYPFALSARCADVAAAFRREEGQEGAQEKRQI